MGDVATGVAHDTTWPFVVAAEELRAENERLRSVVAGVEALAEEMDDKARQAQNAASTARWKGWPVEERVYIRERDTFEYGARRLRSVLSDTKGEAQ